MTQSHWSTKAESIVADGLVGARLHGTSGSAENDEYRRANAEIIRQTARGVGVVSGRKNAASGIRIVYNVSSAHVRAVLTHGYKNCYELASVPTPQLGSAPPRNASARRLMIDQVVAGLSGPAVAATSLYYGAVELNGAGMRYYGDMCLVLRDDEAGNCLVLYRNSYDLDREPIRKRVNGDRMQLQTEAQALAGRWDDVPDMAVCKILDGAAGTPRLMTSGIVSDGILADEDYIEAPRDRSFTVDRLTEIRTAAGDVAAEARIADRLARGPSPSLAELLWRHRRRDAERHASAQRVPVRVIASHGRVRG